MFREGRRETPNAGKDVSSSYLRAPGSTWACLGSPGDRQVGVTLQHCWKASWHG